MTIELPARFEGFDAVRSTHNGSLAENRMHGVGLNPNAGRIASRIKDFVGSVALLFLVGYAGSCLAQDVHNAPDDYRRQVDAAKRVTSLDADIFGDQINEYSGAVTFSVVDISIPGNSKLPVELRRKLNVQELSDSFYINKAMSAWDMDMPYLHASGTFSTRTPNVRCAQPDFNLARPGSAPTSNWYAGEIWFGNYLYTPTNGDEEILHITQNEVRKPQDGLTYYWATKGDWYFSCLSATANNAGGDAFLAHAPDGTRYWFNQLVKYRIPGVWVVPLASEWIPTKTNSYEYRLLPTRIEDRFGNYVTYSYDPVYPERLLGISSNDGRSISITYNSSGQILTAATGTGRTWTYEYVSGMLSYVRRPDGSFWRYEWPGDYDFVASNANCGNSGTITSRSDRNLTMTHPSGAKGVFTFRYRFHGRTYVPKICKIAYNDHYVTYATYDMVPAFFSTFSLGRKEISGPGLATPLVWSWTYPSLVYKYTNDCISTACPTTKIVTLTKPNNSIINKTYGIKYGENDGQLLREEVVSSGTSLKVEDYTFLYSNVGQSYVRTGASFQVYPDPLAGLPTPRIKKKTQLGTRFFEYEVSNASGQYSFDSYARPLSILRKSNVGPGYAKTESLTYYDNTQAWVLSQLATKVDVSTGQTEYSSTFDAVSALPTSVSMFGKVKVNALYNSDGTLASLRDGNSNTTSFSGWKRGVPGLITYQDNTSQVAAIDDNGWVTSVTNEVQAKTCYSFDIMGQLSGVTYPSETTNNACDNTKWTPTTRSFARINYAELGIVSGHWRETVTNGNATQLTYYDAFWRPILVHEYDSNNQIGTQRFTKTAYDLDGRAAFMSYPLSSTTSAAQQYGELGVWTYYDALGRVTSSTQDSELTPSLLISTTVYNPDFSITVTNARLKPSTTSFMAYDEPTTDWPVTINASEGQDTSIVRDIFGKALTVTRSGGGGAAPQTRYYAYNSYQELCKRWEPETRGSIYAYDAAGNLTQSAAGLNTVTRDSTNCNADQFSAGRTVTRSYDGRNRLKTLTFPDNKGDQTWNYYNDGLPQSVSTNNDGNIVTNAYTYNMRRLLIGESMKPDTIQLGWGMGYGYNGLGQIVSEAYPASVSVNYAVNALGQTNQITASSDGGPATTIASAASYFPNGALKQFTYGNGIVHTMTQNARQLPSRSTDGTVLDLGTTFDANGNVAGVTDYTASARQTKLMTYDGLDRLTSASSPMFGTASYSYDTLDNLKTVVAPARTHTYNYNADNNRLLSVTDTVTGASVIGMNYDLQGNLFNKNGVAYIFDFGNRLRTTAGLTYRYDADGRRVRQDAGGLNLKYGYYAKDGRLVWQRDEPASKRISNLYLAGSLVAEYSRPIGSGPVTVNYLHTDALGSPIARTNSAGVSLDTSEYEPYGKLLNRANDDRAGYSGHVMDSASGMTYMQQRYYDSQIGRFMSVDPVTANTSTGANFNRYWYANNNPYSYKDPDGRSCKTVNGRMNCEPNMRKGYDLPGFSLPAPDGWPSVVGKSLISHEYRYEDAIGSKSEKSVQKQMVIDPSPGNDMPATPNGTNNDASPASGWRGPVAKGAGGSPIKSYVFSDRNGNSWIVNVTMPGHPLFPGYVLRGSINEKAITYGEGDALLQALGPFSQVGINDEFKKSNQEAIKKADGDGGE